MTKPTAPIDTAHAKLVRRGPQPGIRLEFGLRQHRECVGMTVEQVAKILRCAPVVVEEVEARLSLDNMTVLSLRNYLAAIGLGLELISTSAYGHRIGVTGARSEAPRVTRKAPGKYKVTWKAKKEKKR